LKLKIIGYTLAAIGILFGLKIVGGTLGWFSEAVDVVREETAPREVLRKYEWFKDTAAVLAAKRSNIKIFATKVRGLEDDYEGVSRKDWSRSDKNILSLWNQELAGIKSSYNGLAAEYNAQMAKINWRFANLGGLPAGETEVLPKEFAAYVSE
jgi:hypothetical protein